MPLIALQEIKPGIRVALWKPDESLTEMLSLLSNKPQYKILSESCKTEKRKTEKLTTRFLTNLLQGKDTEISYEDNGKPYLIESPQHISISHTHSCIAVAISEHPIGIDVEHIAPKVIALKEKFLNPSEIQSIDPANELIHTLLLWSAKESVFKTLNTAEVDFKKNIQIWSFTPKENGIFNVSESRTPQQVTYQVFYQVYPQFVLTISYPPANPPIL